MNVYLGNRLPDTYQEVEYIQSSGTQRINSGYKGGSTIKVQTKISGFTETGSHEIIGADTSWKSNGYTLGPGRICYYNTQYVDMGYNDGNEHILELSNNGFYVDGVQKTTVGSTSFQTSVNLAIFALNRNGSISEYGSFKLHYLKIRDSGTLVRDFVPCYRKSDSVIGLYDLVNNQFYTNAGTGTFSKGSDVYTPAELKNAYIGKVYEYEYDFRNKSTSQLTTDGWSYSTGVTPQFGTYGVYSGSQAASRLTYDITGKLTNAKKITIGMTGTLSNCSMTNGIAKTVTSSTREGLTRIGLDSEASAYFMQIYDTNNSFSGLSDGTLTQRGVIDLVNKTWKLSTTGKSDQTGTLTNAQVSNILNNSSKIFAYVNNCTSSGGLTTVKLTIEY